MASLNFDNPQEEGMKWERRKRRMGRKMIRVRSRIKRRRRRRS